MADRDALPPDPPQAATAAAPAPAFPGAANFQYPQIPYAAAAQSFFGAAGAPAAEADAGAGGSGGKAPRGGASGAPQDERELKRQRRKQSNRESARRSRLRKQAECEELGSRVGGLTEENEKLRADLKYNIDRITQSQKLDLNLEKGRLRELHGIQESQMKEVEARVDRELHQMRTQIEAAKTEIIRYSVGTLVSLGALSLAAIRLVM